MRFRTWLWLLMTVVVLGSLAATHKLGQSMIDWALMSSILLVSAFTLDRTALRPAEIVVEEPDGLEECDLSFFLRDDEERQVPRDFLLQAHAILANVGAKKAIVTLVKIREFRTKDGRAVSLPEFPDEIGGHQYKTWDQWRDTEQTFYRQQVHSPFLLEANESMLIRFRGRRGIDWSDRWTLEDIEELYEALYPAIDAAVVEVRYRWGEESATTLQEVPLEVEQLEEYREQLRRLTDDFESLPDVKEEQLTYE